SLELLYEQQATIIKNLVLFNDSVEKKLYSGGSDFAEVYPFVPYQFHLLGSVLTAIRTHGASGKHLAEGERSMLALFKESAVQIKDKEQGALVPFNMFYDALEQFLEHSHSGVIIHAWDSDILNPNRDEECFAVNVLKTLFMIKNVKEIEANIENITSLMVSSIDEDRLELQKRVEESLKALESQTLIQKNGTIYIFLTDEEQEVNQEIEKQNVEIAEVIGRLAETIFSDIYAITAYRHSVFGGRYTFGFNQVLDDRPYKSNQRYDITLRILTPNAEIGTDETRLRMKSAQENSVIVVLPNDRSYIDELRLALKIEKYLTRNAENSTDKREQIKAVKRLEAKERRKNSELFLKEAMKSSVIYVNGDVLQSSAKDFSSRINDAMGKLVATVYHKLSYIDTAMGEMDIRKMLQKTSQIQLEEDKEMSANKLALNDAIEYIGMNSVNHAKTSLRTAFDRFTKAPYGFIDDDVRWIVARLFKNGDIAMFINNESISLIDKSCEDIIRYLTKRDFADKLLLDKRERANERQKKAAKDIMKELFGISVSTDDDDMLMSDFMKKIGDLKSELEKLEIRLDNRSAYPGKMILRAGKSLVSSVIGIKSTTDFYAEICNKKNDFLDFADDYEPLKAFFAGEQVKIFDRTLEKMKIYEESKTFIVNNDLEKVVDEIYAIIKKSAPYSEIFKLPDLLDKYIDAYSDMLNQMVEPIREAVTESKQRVYDELDGKRCESQLKESFNKRWFELSEKIEHCHNVAILQNIKVEADALKNRMLNEIAATEERVLEQEAKEQEMRQEQEKEKEKVDPEMLRENSTYQTSSPSKPKQKQRKYISIRNVVIESSWQLESEEDIDKYLKKLRERLLKTLENDTVIHIEL
ncbi:MAG: BREX system P-loop protein BrxC, partial [Ruminococcus flavefaciens]|nr:BREX system P-loop protein BrxC [Ruminococcus flavefaciens]